LTICDKVASGNNSGPRFAQYLPRQRRHSGKTRLGRQAELVWTNCTVCAAHFLVLIVIFFPAAPIRDPDYDYYDEDGNLITDDVEDEDEDEDEDDEDDLTASNIGDEGRRSRWSRGRF
jgi:hypothetical protein